MTSPIRKARVSLQPSSHPTDFQSQDANNQRPALAEPVMAEPVMAEPVMAEPVMDEPVMDEPVMDEGAWKTHLTPDSRHRIVNKIMDKLKRHLPVSGQEGLRELRKIAERFEEKIYSAATSQSDYLRKISLKILTMETKSFDAATDSLPSNSAGDSKKSSNGKKSPAGKKSHKSK